MSCATPGAGRRRSRISKGGRNHDQPVAVTTGWWAMMGRLRPAVAPAYLFLCLLLGGSHQGMWGNAILQLLAVGLIAWALLERREDELGRPTKQLFILVSLAILLV